MCTWGRGRQGEKVLLLSQFLCCRCLKKQGLRFGSGREGKPRGGGFCHVYKTSCLK